MKEDRNPAGPAPSPSPLDLATLTRGVEEVLARRPGAVVAGVGSDADARYEAAVGAPTIEAEFEALQAAFRLDPSHVDTLLVLVRHVPVTAFGEIALLRRIVELAERQLGSRGLREVTGSAWDRLENRPYLRARYQLAEALQADGQIELARVEWEALLQLNPADHQGVRYSLLACCLMLHRMPRAAELLGLHREEGSHTVFAWGRVLERWVAGDLPGALAARVSAQQQNPHTEAYLTGRRRLPTTVPPLYSPGSREESVCYARLLRRVWKAHPKALRWLKALPPEPEPEPEVPAEGVADGESQSPPAPAPAE
jgi:tetratricopeptide (TPR) repeat protein